MNNIPAATKIDTEMGERASRACRATKLKMSDLLRIGLDRLLGEFESTGRLNLGSLKGKPSKKKEAR